MGKGSRTRKIRSDLDSLADRVQLAHRPKPIVITKKVFVKSLRRPRRTFEDAGQPKVADEKEEDEDLAATVVRTVSESLESSLATLEDDTPPDIMGHEEFTRDAQSKRGLNLRTVLAEMAKGSRDDGHTIVIRHISSTHLPQEFLFIRSTVTELQTLIYNDLKQFAKAEDERYTTELTFHPVSGELMMLLTLSLSRLVVPAFRVMYTVFPASDTEGQAYQDTIAQHVTELFS